MIEDTNIDFSNQSPHHGVRRSGTVHVSAVLGAVKGLPPDSLNVVSPMQTMREGYYCHRGGLKVFSDFSLTAL